MTELETAIADNRIAVDEFIAKARGIDPAAWTASRGEGRWSPAQIAEHLAIVYEYNRKVVTGTAGKGAPRIPAAARALVHRRSDAEGRTLYAEGQGAGDLSAVARRRPGAPKCSARLTKAVSGFESDIRSGHPEGRHHRARIRSSGRCRPSTTCGCRRSTRVTTDRS